MAEYISMKQVPGGTVTAVDDRILYDVNLNSGIIYGCEISYQGNNMIHINAGYGVIKGGLFEMEDHTEYVEYAEDEPTTGQIYLKFDAAAVDKLVIVKETSNTLHPLEQDEDANYDSGVYEMQLCTFTATTTALTDVTQTFPIAEGAVDVLDSLTDIMANTDSGKAAGALAVKELNTNLMKYKKYTANFSINGNEFKPEAIRMALSDLGFNEVLGITIDPYETQVQITLAFCAKLNSDTFYTLCCNAKNWDRNTKTGTAHITIIGR